MVIIALQWTPCPVLGMVLFSCKVILNLMHDVMWCLAGTGSLVVGMLYRNVSYSIVGCSKILHVMYVSGTGEIGKGVSKLPVFMHHWIWGIISTRVNMEERGEMIEELPNFTNCRFLNCFFLALFFFSAVIFGFVGDGILRGNRLRKVEPGKHGKKCRNKNT